MNVYMTSKRIKEAISLRRIDVKNISREGINDKSKNNQRDDKRIKSD